MTTGAQQEAQLGTDFFTQLGTLALPPGTTVGGHLVEFNFRRAAASTVTESGVAWGIIVQGTGVSATSPVTALHDDWIWHENSYFHTDATLAHRGTGTDGVGVRRVRAMRRLDEIGMELTLTAQPLSGAETISAHFKISTMLILP